MEVCVKSSVYGSVWEELCVWKCVGRTVHTGVCGKCSAYGSVWGEQCVWKCVGTAVQGACGEHLQCAGVRSVLWGTVGHRCSSGRGRALAPLLGLRGFLPEQKHHAALLSGVKLCWVQSTMLLSRVLLG